MTSVDANADPRFVVDQVDDGLQLLEVSANGVALLGHILQDHFDTGGSLQHQVNFFRDLTDTVVPRDCATRRTYAEIGVNMRKVQTK